MYKIMYKKRAKYMLQSLRIKYKNMLYSDNKKWGRVFFVYNKMYKGMPEVLAKKKRLQTMQRL